METFLATAAFGLEGVVANELKRLKMNAKAENGGARFQGSYADAYRANLALRCADRVLQILLETKVESFEDLFEAVHSIPWENFLSRNASVHVSGKCVRSRLMSVRDCQSVGKKAIADRLCKHYHIRLLPENGPEYPIELAIVNNQLRVTLDFSGIALNNRGYRTWNGEAPLRETMAAALIDLSPWRKGIRLYDPCCGTGTLLIEAAIKAIDRPAGINRSFACEKYTFLTQNEMASIRKELTEAMQPDLPFRIEGSDISPEALALCGRHIHQAGFDGRISICRKDLRQLQLEGEPGVFILNPPYGERLMDQNSARELYRNIGKMFRRHPGWKLCAITADPSFERYFGKRADKKRRLYNGRLECDFYQFFS